MTAQPPRVLLASPRAFCAGVERAIEIVERTLQRHGAPVYVRKQLVHNEHVVRDLRAKGAVFVEELDDVPAGAVVVFSAHGVSPAVRAEAARRGLRTVDATCPLVAKVHLEARRFAARGDTIVFIGQAGHDEAEGAIGEAPDRTVLVETAEDVAALAPSGRVSYLTQTTLAIDETAAVVDALRARFPDLRGPRGDDICYATTNRQRAVAAVAAEADVVIVVGSRNSSNSNRLVEVARKRGVPAYLVDDVSQFDPRWLRGATTVGVTAGASAPPPLVAELVQALCRHGAAEVVEWTVATETVAFSLPADVR
jgi:4-hydroxy-3-methylbut-2-enyl diphosphate reductase